MSLSQEAKLHMNFDNDLESEPLSQKQFLASQEEEIKDNLEEAPINARRFKGSNRGLLDSFESDLNDDKNPSEE